MNRAETEVATRAASVTVAVNHAAAVTVTVLLCVLAAVASVLGELDHDSCTPERGRLGTLLWSSLV